MNSKDKKGLAMLLRKWADYTTTLITFKADGEERLTNIALDWIIYQRFYKNLKVAVSEEKIIIKCLSVQSGSANKKTQAHIFKMVSTNGCEGKKEFIEWRKAPKELKLIHNFLYGVQNED